MRGFESMDGGFKKIGSAGFGVDVQRRADAEVASKGVVFWTWLESHLIGGTPTPSRLDELGW